MRNSLATERTEEEFESAKAGCAAAIFIIKHEARRTNSWEELKASFKSSKGTTEEAQLINYMFDRRLVNNRLIQAANEMSSVLAILSGMYTMLDSPTLEEVIIEIRKLGTVKSIHNKYVLDERNRPIKNPSYF